MLKGLIRNYRRKTTATERESFSTLLYESAAGNTSLKELYWDDEVEVDEQTAWKPVSGRTRVLFNGVAGFVNSDHVVILAYVDRHRDNGKWKYTAPLYRRETGMTRLLNLLWGDQVQILRRGSSRSRIRARGYYGWISNSVLTDKSLLELYFIDVGQGDGVLIRTPDNRHILIDGGYPRGRQPTNKNAADFVDWKFFEDYGAARISLDAMIASHCDLDHYGGLDDLLSTSATAQDELDCSGVDVGSFFHPGVSWWEPSSEEINKFNLKGDAKDRWLGPSDDKNLLRLLGDHNDLVAALAEDAFPRLQGMWRAFLSKVAKATSNVNRLGVDVDEVGQAHVLPGFEPGSERTSIRVLAPVTRQRYNQPTILDLGDESQNTNGHSLVLRLDYRHTRILLTGDLNKKSMQALHDIYGEYMREFACDVVKACHHGSEDVSYEFLQAVRAAATVISSGDIEGHAHPRSAIVAASGLTGHMKIDTERDELVTPLVYSTEIERSHRLGRMDRIEVSGLPHGEESIDFNLFARNAKYFNGELKHEAEAQQEAKVKSWIHFREARPAWFRAKRESRRLRGSYVVVGVHYGLVNVRTNGEHIICATKKEDREGWTVRSFTARF